MYQKVQPFSPFPTANSPPQPVQLKHYSTGFLKVTLWQKIKKNPLALVQGKQ